MELPEFCDYLNKSVSKRELREICQIINIPFYEDEKTSDTCFFIFIKDSAGYIMSPKYMNILKVLAKYRAYIISVLGLLYLASRNSKAFNNYNLTEPSHQILSRAKKFGQNAPSLNAFSWEVFKGNLKSLRFLYARNYLVVPNIISGIKVVVVNEPILLFLAQITVLFGIGSLISDTLGALGLNTGGIISGFEPIKSKIRHQVFKVLGKDTRESEGGNRKRTIKKIR